MGESTVDEKYEQIMLRLRVLVLYTVYAPGT